MIRHVRLCFFSLLISSLLGSSELLAQPRSAQCLLEVKGVHYIGGPCSLVPIDKYGSFRITDVQGLNLVAQVNVNGSDEGKLVWNGPLGGSQSATEIGTVSHSDACWMADDAPKDGDYYLASRVCVWTGNEEVYLGPSTKSPPDYSVVYYGSRIGMYNEIVSQDGIGTPQARIVTRPSKDGAVTFCREYAHDYSVKCVDDGMKTDGALVLTGNCREKTFLDFTKRRFRFLGKLPHNSDARSAEFAIRDVTSGEILDGSSASGYDVELGVFRALCPDRVPRR
jgi:hypothetical protein